MLSSSVSVGAGLCFVVCLFLLEVLTLCSSGCHFATVFGCSWGHVLPALQPTSTRTPGCINPSLAFLSLFVPAVSFGCALLLCPVDDDQPPAAHHVAQPDRVHHQDCAERGEAYGAGHDQQGGGTHAGCDSRGAGTSSEGRAGDSSVHSSWHTKACVPGRYTIRRACQVPELPRPSSCSSKLLTNWKDNKRESDVDHVPHITCVSTHCPCLRQPRPAPSRCPLCWLYLTTSPWAPTASWMQSTSTHTSQVSSALPQSHCRTTSSVNLLGASSKSTGNHTIERKQGFCYKPCHCMLRVGCADGFIHSFMQPCICHHAVTPFLGTRLPASKGMVIGQLEHS